MKKAFTHLSGLCLLFFPIIVHAQKALEHPTKMFVDSTGRVNVHVSKPIYLFIATESDGSDAVKMESQKTPQYANPMYFDGHGVHYIRHLDYHHHIPEGEVVFEVNVDALPPTTLLHVQEGKQFVINGKTYCGSNLKVGLSAKDQMTGVDQIYYTLNKGTFQPYKDPIAIDQEGLVELAFYAVDKVGNVEPIKYKSFIIDKSAPKVDLLTSGNIVDKHIFGKGAEIKILANDQSAGVKSIFYQLNQGNWQQAPNGIVKSDALSDGQYQLAYYAEDHLGNKSQVENFDFYVDKTPPLIESAILGNRFNTRGRNYISSRTKVRLNAQDNKAGVENIYYSLDGQKYELYEEPFMIKPRQGGFVVKYYAQDRVGNKSLSTTDGLLGAIYMDLTPPKISHSFVGASVFERDTFYVSEKTLMKVIATDDESGLQTTAYFFNQDQEQNYDPQKMIGFQGLKGINLVNYYALDEVDNKSESNIIVVVDSKGPEIFHHFGSEPIGTKTVLGKKSPIYSKQTLIYLAATDDYVGTSKIFYSINGGAEKLYSQPILLNTQGNQKLRIRAVDRLGNITESETIEFAME